MDPALLILVAAVLFKAPISDASNIYSFEEPPSEEMEPGLRAQLIDEAALYAQRVLTEQLGRQPNFQVVPFGEARRLIAGSHPGERSWANEELEELGRSVGADVVVGTSTAWNPLAMGACLVYDLATDLLLRYGGAYVLGWAFRPVHFQMCALQLKPCVKRGSCSTKR